MISTSRFFPYLFAVFLFFLFQTKQVNCRPITYKPDFKLYSSITALNAKVDELGQNYPDTLQVSNNTATNGTYTVKIKVVTYKSSVIRKSPNDTKFARMLINCGEHGRELISSEFCLELLKTLLSPQKLEEAAGSKARAKTLQLLLDNTIIQMLPLQNPTGRARVESGKICERKNGRGVDTNRNWPFDWGRREKDYNPAEENPGDGPFSEPESQLLHKLAEALHPHVWLNVHSGMAAMFVPWDHRAEVAAGLDPALAILKQIHTSVMNGTDCVVGSGGKMVGYLAHGTATDYMHGGMHVPMPYTWEIYGDLKAPYEECFQAFNPLTQKAVEDVNRRWTLAFLRLLELMPGHPALAGTAVAVSPGQKPGGASSPVPAAQGEGEKSATRKAGGKEPLEKGVGTQGTNATAAAGGKGPQDGEQSTVRKTPTPLTPTFPVVPVVSLTKGVVLGLALLFLLLLILLSPSLVKGRPAAGSGSHYRGRFAALRRLVRPLVGLEPTVGSNAPANVPGPGSQTARSKPVEKPGAGAGAGAGGVPPVPGSGAAPVLRSIGLTSTSIAR